MEHAINVVFEGVSKNFKKASKDFINSVSKGQTIRNIVLNYNGYIVHADKALIDDVVVINGYTEEHEKVTHSFIHIKPLGVARIVTTDEANEDFIGPIEHAMEWIEEIEGDPEYACKGEFNVPLAISDRDIIQAKL